jgi:6-pyruvoyltetrahydropterin/6-carboxytetrahydropterin synthase
MKIVINGIHANLRFSSAHMIAEHNFCGRLHGHSYHVDVVLEGKRTGKFGFVVDFKTIKDIIREICSELDHRVLIPCKADEIKFINIQDSLEFQIGQKKYLLPLEDCCLLATKSTSAEDLAEYIASKVYKSLERKNVDFSSLQICVNEGIGQGAYFIKVRE